MGATLPFQEMFEFKCLLDDLNIRLSSRIENGVKQLLALITDDGDILLYYTYGELCSILKRVPWFSDPNKTVQALCFDPSATWLLVVCLDCSLYIIPALSLVDKKQKIDCKWSVHDLTHFPKPPQVVDAKPSTIVWWQTLDCNQNALVGFENGSIHLISLTDGRCFGTCSITETILNLNLFNDNSLDAVSLMINGVSGQQWKLVLEQHSIGYLWPPDANIAEDSSRSRLQNLKQLSAEKLAYLKQRFTESRHTRRDSQTSDSESVSSDASHSGPELLPHLCDTHFAPQYAKNRYLFSAFYKPTCLVTVHSGDVESAPLYVHKLQQRTDYLLLTDRLIYTVNSDLNTLSILSSQLSECRLEGDSEFNPDSLIAQFVVTKENEKILNLYKLTDITVGRDRRKKDETESRMNILPKTIGELLISRVKVDTCIVVTNVAVYKLITKCSPVHKFINLIIEDCNVEKAEKLAIIFGLNLQRLFESCGDLLVSNGSFHQGLILYKQAKIHLLKRVLKLAVAADCKSLLKFIHLCLSASRVDMSIGTKIHIGNLAVMAYTELLLRYNGNMRSTNTKDFMKFLCFEEYYDQVLAVNVACQAGHWKIVTLLTKARGLQPETVVALSQILQTTRAPRPTEYDFLIALSEPTLLQSLLIYPTSCQIILNYVRENMNQFPVNVLKRFALQLDPSQPCATPLVSKIQVRYRRDTTSNESSLEQGDLEPPSHSSSIVKEIVETFIFVLLTLVQKTEDRSYSLELLERIPAPSLKPEENTIPQSQYPRLNAMDCGFEHIGVIRNNNLYMMGISTAGCLGLGPLLTQSSPIKIVSSLSELKVKVLSVSCGRKHTLALTEFGVYSWGSNYYGQLGLDTLLQESPYPQLVTSLIDYRIIDVKAGQYHSLALTSSGKVFTWGWGIHGQLGHGISANEFYPRELEFSQRVKQIAAGYAHSFVLTVEGKVYGFGSNAFGQLEICNLDANKSTKPVWVLITPDFYTPIENIYTSYFHNICSSADQEVFVWGASPQEVRVSQSKSNQKLNGIDPKVAETWKSCVRIYTSKTQKPIEEVSIGFKYAGILHNGKVICGKSKESELVVLANKDGVVTVPPRFMHVASGYDYMLAMMQNGKLLAWGNTAFAQKIISRQQPEEQPSVMMIRNAKGRCVRISNTKEGSFEGPFEIPGLPSIAINFDTPANSDHRLVPRQHLPYEIRYIENENVYEKKHLRPITRNNSLLERLQESSSFKFGQKTLHYVLETYSDLYDYENILSKCLETQNYQAASKIAIIDEHYGDSLSFQLKAFKKYMDGFDLEFNINIVPKDDDMCNMKNAINKQNDINDRIAYSSNSPSHLLSSSSSLENMRQWADEEHQRGCDSPCDFSDLGDIRQNMSEYVQSFKNESPPITNVSKIISSQPTYIDHKSNEFDFEVHIKDKNTREMINIASSLVEFYIKKTYATENHILMQNILMKCIEFWLTNNLPVCILEKVLLKNMDKYFYPLSILLFCKNFNNTLDDRNEMDPNEQKPAGFLKDFSTKFCLQLCSMVLENACKG